MLSIIIPTLNEEKCLPSLLENIKNQTYRDYEIIVSDADSSDKTIEIAKQYNCKFFIEKDINRKHPSFQRNNGVKLAQGDLLLFLDADTDLPNNYFLEKTIAEFNFKKLSVAGFFLDFKSNKFFYKFYRRVYNGVATLAQWIKPLALGAGIIIKRELHDKINGFNEELYIGEDQVYVEQASKFGKFRLIQSTKIFFSIRRFEKEGPWKLFFKIVYSTLYVIFCGPIKKKIIKYDLKGY